MCPERPSRLGIGQLRLSATRLQIAETWLRIMVDRYCDVQPDESHVHLPFGHKQDIYDMYKRYEAFVVFYNLIFHMWVEHVFHKWLCAQ
jgi:hypothetical protein